MTKDTAREREGDRGRKQYLSFSTALGRLEEKWSRGIPGWGKGAQPK